MVPLNVAEKVPGGLGSGFGAGPGPAQDGLGEACGKGLGSLCAAEVFPELAFASRFKEIDTRKRCI